MENQQERDHLKTKGIDENNVKRDLEDIGWTYVE
jgi:hypothetical protein